MKKISFMLILVGMTGFAQVKGNKTIETRTFNVQNIEHIKIDLYAKVTIDPSLSEGLTITTDKNLFVLIEKDVIQNTLHLNQKEWIQASQDIIITIGAPKIKSLTTGTHDLTKVINLNNERLEVTAPIGTIKLQGQTKSLKLAIKLAKIDASLLKADEAFVNIWGRGNATVNVTQYLEADVSNNGRVYYKQKPLNLKQKIKNEGKIIALSEKYKEKNPEAKYITFKIQNNSINRHQFKVIGPKPDGTKFGYGFPMMPFTTRKENWTIGTQVYKVNTLGFEKLLVTITASDENKTVKLF